MRVVQAQIQSGKSGGQLNLEHLQLQAHATLDPSSLPGIQKIILREIQIVRRALRQSCAGIDPENYCSRDNPHDDLPLDCSTAIAILEFYPTTPRSPANAPPASVFPERPIDAQTLQRWAALHGLSLASEPPDNPDEQAMAIP